MKAGTLPAEEFYAWSKKAREKKAAHDSGKIPQEEYIVWLKES